MNHRDLEGNLLIAELIVKSIKEELTPEEKLILASWIAEDDQNRKLFEELASSEIDKDLEALSNYDIEKAEKQVMAGIHRGRVIGWKKYAAAAAAAVLVIYFGYNFYQDDTRAKDTFTVNRDPVSSQKPVDISAPESVNAVLTLADGTNLILDSLDDGRVPNNGSVTIKKLGDGQLVYDEVPSTAEEVLYNTLTVPRGSKIVNLTLSDGTRVTLNAASSITFPTRFAGRTRTVTMTGEAYFEVAHNRSKPFLVKKGEAEVEVLGTHFNVNAYDNENALSVTLVEGRVKVTRKAKNEAVILAPGQMARLNDRLDLLKNVDLEEILAWKEGKFRFGELASIESVMRQISRWYDVEVEYRGKIKGHIGGTIERESSVSQVLAILEMTGVVKFSMDGRKIIVLPK